MIDGNSVFRILNLALIDGGFRTPYQRFGWLVQPLVAWLALLGALAGAAPDRVPAASQGTMNNVLIGSDEVAAQEVTLRDLTTGDQERINDELRQDLSLLRDELSLQVADHEQRLAKLEAGGGAALPATAEPLPTPQVTQPAVATVLVPSGESAPELYDRALKMIRETQDFSAGRELMEMFLKRYPDHDLAVNAAYWIGETYYAEKNYEQAILQFEEIIQKYGDHPKVASAMLKQALAFESSGDNATARLLLQRVVERFPLSDEAGKAKQKLQAG